MQYWAIEGNIAAGKTTLLHLLHQHFPHARTALEPFRENPFLERFYQNPEKYALALELSFLALRYEQLNRYLQPSLFDDLVISDHSIYRSWVFGQVTLPEHEFVLFERLYRVMERSLRRPDIMIWIRTPIARLMEHLRRRNRPYEQAITETYLQRIDEQYERLFDDLKHFVPLIVVHLDAEDLVQHPDAAIPLIQYLRHQDWKPGTPPVVIHL